MSEKKANAEGQPRHVPLPFTTFGEIAVLGLDAHVYCVGCKHWGQIGAADPRWTQSTLRRRAFALHAAKV